MSFNTNDKFNTLSGTLIQSTTISASVISASMITGSVAITAAGANTQIQFNDSGSFGATGSFTYDKNQQNLRVGNIQGLDSNTYLTIKAPAGEFSGVYLTGATHTLMTNTGDVVTVGNSLIELSTSSEIRNTANNINIKNYSNTQKYPETVYITSDPGYNPYYPELFRIATSYVGAAPSTTASIGDALMVSEFGDVGNSKLYVEGYITASVGISASIAKFDSLTASNSLVANTTTIGNYVQLLPITNPNIPSNTTASYIYTSGSTNDMYFTQYGGGFTNTTRLRWLEGSLSTGLLHGGVLSTVTGTTTFNLSSGSGIILTYNATTTNDPYPTIKQVSWGNFVSQSLIYSGSSPITYIAVDDNGAISQTNVGFTAAQFKDRIVIGRVLHQSGAVTNGTITAPTTAYGISSNTQDFFRAFGPLKVSGNSMAASGSATLAITRTAGDSYVEGKNYSIDPNQPNYIKAANDAALTTTKIFYEWVSGSTVNIDNNGGAGYTALIPNKYSLNGTVTTITPTNNKFTVQRAYWFPNSVTRAIFVYYGTAIYSSLADAVAAVSDEPTFSEGDNTKTAAIYLGSIIMEAGISNFTDTTKSKIINGGLFRSTSNGGGGGGGGGTTSPGGSTHQIQYNDTGVFNGSANLTFDTTTFALTGTMNVSGNVNISNGTLSGSTARMTVITGSSITGSTGIIQTITSSQEAIYTTSDMGSFTAGGIVSSGLTKTGSVAANASDTYGIYFHPSGTYMYAVDLVQDKVFEYSLSTPWDVSTIAYTSVTASIAAEEATAQDIFFHPSGTYFYVIGTSGDDINQYSMSPAWSLGSSTFFASSSANGYESVPSGIFFKPDGTSVFIVGSVTNTVRQHSLTTPWNVSTMVTSSVVSSVNLSTIITFTSGLTFSNDGKKMYIVNSTAGTRTLYEFPLTTSWDLTTVNLAKYINHDISNANNTMTSTSTINGLFLRPDGTNMYFMNLATDKVIQYDMKNASLSVGNGVLQVADGLAVYGVSSFGDMSAKDSRFNTVRTVSSMAVGTSLTIGTTLSASSTIQAGGAITGSAGMNISGGPTTIGGGAGQNLTVSTSLQVTGPTPTFSNAITASGGITGSIAKFDTVIGKYATYTANFNVPTASYFFGISTTGSVVTASLTGAASYYAGQTLVFKDIAGSASLNNIYIRPSGSETIDGGSGALIATPSGSLTIVSNGTNGFYIIGMV